MDSNENFSIAEIVSKDNEHLINNEKTPFINSSFDDSSSSWRPYLAAFLGAHKTGPVSRVGRSATQSFTILGSLLSISVGTVGSWSSPAVAILTSNNSRTLGIGKLTEEEVSWIASLMHLGGFCGSIPAGNLSFYFGRKRFLLTLAIPFIVGWLLIVYNFGTVWFIYAGRFICGISCGSLSVASPIYNNEICENNNRGRIGIFYDLLQCFGVLWLYGLGIVFDLYWSTLLCIIIPLTFLITFIWMPESPTYLVRKGSKEKAIESLSNVTVKAVSIACFLLILQRSCGGSMVIYFVEPMLKRAKSSIDMRIASLINGIAQVVFSLLTVLFVDSVGRKVLLLFTFGVMAGSITILAIYVNFITEGHPDLFIKSFDWIPLFCLTLFVGMFRFGVSPIPWFMAPEIIPTEAQRWAPSAIVCITWSMSFLMTRSFLPALTAFGQTSVYLCFTLICLIGVIFTWTVVPETRNKSREQIQMELGAVRYGSI